jgi:choline dehydrogenase-like flavoprotein
MVIDGRGISEGDELEADVCIVGAGPAGISLALALARVGRHVCLVESGGREPEAEAQRLNEGASVGYWYYPLAATRVRAFGGTSAHWFAAKADAVDGWRTRPLDPVDFEARPGIPHSGWPFGYSELRRYYERAQELCRLGPYEYETARWETEAARKLTLNGRIDTQVFQQGFENFVGYFKELSDSARVTLVLHATALEIETDGPAGQATRLIVGRSPSETFSVRGRLYVLAAGGIENARLLLLSRGSQASGLGNGEDLVGRFFMEKLSGRVGFIAPASPELLGRVSLYLHRRVGTTSVQGFFSPTDEVVREEGLLNCAFFVVPHYRASASDGVRSAATLYRALRRRPLPRALSGHARNVVAGLDDIARLAYRGLQSGAQHDILALRVQAEQSPNPDSRVTLDAERDAFGLPRARLDWRVTEFDHWSIRRAQNILDEEFGTAGLGRVEQKLGDETPPSLFLGNFHHIGTTRMHEDRRRGVVDANCQVHGVSNLFVAGSSVFPTAGYANPTLTIVALALRLADHLHATLGARSAGLPR